MFHQYKNKALFGVLIDPEKQHSTDLLMQCDILKQIQAIDFYLLGGTFVKYDNMICALRILKSKLIKPVYLFPGLSAPEASIIPGADGIILPFVLGSQNSHFLFGWHLEASKLVQKYDLRVFPFGYLMVRESQKPIKHNGKKIYSIRHNDIQLAKRIVYTANMLGFMSIYLEAGSGSCKVISSKLIREVKGINKEIRLTVGGGLKSKEAIAEVVRSGADIVIVGNAIEKKCEIKFIQDLASGTKAQLRKKSN